MGPVGLFGYGAHGRDIEEVWNRAHLGENLLRFDDNPNQSSADDFPLDVPCYVGLNWPWDRREVAKRLWPVPPPALVDPSAVVGSGCSLAGGVIIFPATVLLRDVELGEHVHVGYSASMTRCTVGAFTTISPGALICGDVQIGDEVLIGCGAVVKNLVKIGDGAVIGAGAVVIDDVPAGATVVGIPARASIDPVAA